MGKQVKNFDVAEIPQLPKMEELVGWDVALFPRGDTLYDDNYDSEGYIVHVVARNPETGDILFSDPAFPYAIWQVVLKRICDRSNRLSQWVFIHIFAQKNKHGGQTFMGRSLNKNEEERKDALYDAVAEYMINEIGLSPEDEVAPALRQTLSIESPERPSLLKGESFVSEEPPSRLTDHDGYEAPF